MEGTLDRTLDSCMNYWLEVIKDNQERASIRELTHKFVSGSKTGVSDLSVGQPSEGGKPGDDADGKEVTDKREKHLATGPQSSHLCSPQERHDENSNSGNECRYRRVGEEVTQYCSDGEEDEGEAADKATELTSVV